MCRGWFGDLLGSHCAQLTLASCALQPRARPGVGWGGRGGSWGWDSGRGQVWVTDEAVGSEVLQLSQTHRLQRFVRDSSAVSGRAVVCW